MTPIFSGDLYHAKMKILLFPAPFRGTSGRIHRWPFKSLDERPGHGRKWVITGYISAEARVPGMERFIRQPETILFSIRRTRVLPFSASCNGIDLKYDLGKFCWVFVSHRILWWVVLIKWVGLGDGEIRVYRYFKLFRFLIVGCIAVIKLLWWDEIIIYFVVLMVLYLW